MGSLYLFYLYDMLFSSHLRDFLLGLALKPDHIGSTDFAFTSFGYGFARENKLATCQLLIACCIYHVVLAVLPKIKLYSERLQRCQRFVETALRLATKCSQNESRTFPPRTFPPNPNHKPNPNSKLNSNTNPNPTNPTLNSNPNRAG